MTNDMKPLIGISGCSHETEDGAQYYKVGEKYVSAIVTAADGIPVMFPPIGEATDIDGLLSRIDGLFLTGSPSNVEPHHYEGEPSREGTEHDPARDRTTLPMIRRAIELGIPLFALCRGHQELNVVLGGTLFQNVQELEGKRDHRMRQDLPHDARYNAAHAIDIKPGGILETLNGGAGEVMVNSLHAQAIDRPAEGLFIEAVSDDGVIEAVSLPAARAFTLGVQWHPEHKTALQWPLSRAIFQAFGEAARARLKSRSDRRAA